MTVMFDKSEPDRVRDWTTRTHASWGTVTTPHGDYRFYVARFLVPRAVAPGERPYPRRKAVYMMDLYDKDGLVYPQHGKIMREVIENRFRQKFVE